MEVNITDERPELDLIITEENQEFDVQISDDGQDVTVNIDDESNEVLIEISDEETPTKITIEESHGLSAYQLYLATTTANPPLSLKDWLDSLGGGSATQYIDSQIDSALNTFINVTYLADKANLQSQIDGKIDTWFANSDPSAEWTSVEKTAHTGDMWYDNTAKELKRWNGASWDLIQDQTALSAYQAANNAQDTADGKRTVFVAQPTTEQAYEVGDLWVNATVGTYVNEILRAQTAKASGADFNLEHWVKASKYTDDSALNAFVSVTYSADKDNLQIGRAHV